MIRQNRVSVNTRYCKNTDDLIETNAAHVPISARKQVFNVYVLHEVWIVFIIKYPPPPPPPPPPLTLGLRPRRPRYVHEKGIRVVLVPKRSEDTLTFP